MKIDGEKAYPIWSIGLKWVEDDDGTLSKERDPGVFAGVPEGRMKNGTHRYEMLKEEKTEEELVAGAIEVWKGVEKFQKGNPSELSVKVKFFRYETWGGGWFSHYTFDTGQTEREAHDSFWKFVCRMEDLNRREGKMENGFWRDAYCLMGAEDRWRWKGPCRCEHCKKHGLIRFDH